MQTISAQAATLLASSVRAPSVYVWAQIPVIINQYGNINASLLGSQLVLDHITKFQCTNNINIGADKMDFQFDGMTSDYSPLNNSSKYGRYFAVGAVDIKYQAFLGLTQNGSSSLWPKGVYVSESVNQDSQEGASTFTVNTLDQFSLFTGNAYASFPPRLYGAQNSSYYNPNYALKNPSGDLKTYVSDTAYWMQSNTSLPIWNSDYVQVSVYSSAYSSGGTAVPNSGATAYTINYNAGTVTFTTAQGANDVISVDARPLAMRPEAALYHLFVDYGNWSPNFLKFDQTGCMIPLVELARDRSMIEIAKDIVALIGPRGQRWSLWIDENGYIRLSEQAKDGPPVVTLVDNKDIIKATPEYSTKSMANVVRAKGQISSNQPVVVISYDVYSISTFGQKPTMDVPTQLVNMTKSMDAGSAMSYLNNMCNSLLFEFCRPSLITEIEIKPNPALQVGDAIAIYETKTGIGTVKATRNLLPYSDTLYGWTLSNLTSGNTGPNGSTDAEYIGTGSAITSNLSLQNTFIVTAGQTYTPSWWIDMSQVTHGTLDLRLSDVDGNIIEDVGAGAPGNIAKRYAGNAWTCPTNLMPNSDSMSGNGWTRNAYVYGTGGPNGATDLEYTIPTTQNDSYAQTAPWSVTAGQQYTFSIWCNPSICTSGGLWLLIYDYTSGSLGSQIYGGSLTGPDGRYAHTVTAPTGCTKMVALLRENPAIGVIPAGRVVKWSQPMVEASSSAAGYYISSQTPKVQMQMLAWSGQAGGFIVASGNKFKVAQPQFEAGTTATSYVPGYSSNSYIPSRFRITQIENKVDGDAWSQVLQVERQTLSQDWNFGIAANLGTGESTNADAIATQSGYLMDVSLNNANGPVSHVVSNGQPLTDSAYMPYIFTWNGGPLTVGVTIGNIQSGATAYIWRWLYIAQDVYYNGNLITGNGSVLPAGNNWTGITGNLIGDLTGSTGVSTLPYDVRANVDTPISRKYWWPLLRCSDWLTNDGVTGYTSQTTLTSTWSNGPGIPSGSWTPYGNLVVGKNDFFGDTTAGFVGQELWANGTPGANALGTSSTVKYGVDFGKSFTGTPIYHAIKDKYTPCYLCILVASTSGTMQFKKIPLMLLS